MTKKSVVKKSVIKKAVEAATGTASIQIHVQPETQRRLKMLAASENTKIRTLMLEAMNRLFKSRGIPFNAE